MSYRVDVSPENGGATLKIWVTGESALRIVLAQYGDRVLGVYEA